MEVVSAIAERLDVKTTVDEEVRGLRRDIEPEKILTRIEEKEEELEAAQHARR